MKIPEIQVFDESEKLEILEASYFPQIPLSAQEILRLISRVYFQINNDFGSFNDEVAFLSCEILKNSELYDKSLFKDLIILSLNFVLGFIKFKCEEVSFIDELYKENTDKYFAYNYAFLKFMTPLKEKAKIFLNFAKKYDSDELKGDSEKILSSIIFDSSRILIMLRKNNFSYTKKDLENLKSSLCCPVIADYFFETDKKLNICLHLRKRAYAMILDDYISEIDFSEKEKMAFLKCLVNIFDFKSTQTFTHTISTACYAFSLGKLADCEKIELDELFVSGVLHDIGKMAIPRSVLESMGKLSSTDFTLMRSHVYFSKKMLAGIVPKNIFNIAVHHHEKLDGSGYPDSLTAQELSLQERILTVVDIFSALAQKRTYKREYTKEEILKILKDLAEQNQLDSDLYAIILNNYEVFIQGAEEIKPIFNSPIADVELFYSELV